MTAGPAGAFNPAFISTASPTVKHTFKSLPTREEFLAVFATVYDPVDFHYTYANGDEDGELNSTVADAYEFLKGTLLVGESVIAEINEIDPTP